MSLMSAFSAAQLPETITKLSICLLSSLSLACQTEHPKKKALGSQSLWGLTMFSMGLSLLRDFIMYV